MHSHVSNGMASESQLIHDSIEGIKGQRRLVPLEVLTRIHTQHIHKRHVVYVSLGTHPARSASPIHDTFPYFTTPNLSLCFLFKGIKKSSIKENKIFELK